VVIRAHFDRFIDYGLNRSLDLENSRFFPHGMLQSSMIYNEIKPWGIFLVLGVVLFLVFGAISITKYIADHNNREIPDCQKCGEELANADWEACPVCGESIEAK
jgi:hypothetical protein